MDNIYHFKKINPSKVEWEVIEKTYDGTVYKTQAWFDYLVYQNCKPFIVSISKDNQTIGYFVGELKKRGVWILGAPIEGVGTGNQGLSMLNHIDAKERIAIYREMAKWVFKHRYAVWVQVEDWQLQMEDVENTDLIYEPHDASWEDLTLNEDELFARMDNKSCRYKVKKAIKEGVIVRDTEDTDKFIDVHYDQCLHVMHSKGLEPRRSKEHLTEMIKLLYPDRMILLEAVSPEGKIIATGMYAVSERSASSFSSASYREDSHYCANELIRWEAFKRCKERGALFFNNNGCMSFKLKFGAYRAYRPRIVFSKFRILFSLRKRAVSLFRKCINPLRYRLGLFGQ